MWFCTAIIYEINVRSFLVYKLIWDHKNDKTAYFKRVWTFTIQVRYVDQWDKYTSLSKIMTSIQYYLVDGILLNPGEEDAELWKITTKIEWRVL